MPEFCTGWGHSNRHLFLENNSLMFFVMYFTEEELLTYEKPRICLQTLDRLREFYSDSDQLCNRIQEDSSREKQSLILGNCPSITGRSLELKNPLQYGDTNQKVAQKVCGALIYCNADDFKNKTKQSLGQESFYLQNILHSVIT